MAGKTDLKEVEFPIVAFCARLALFDSAARRVEGWATRAVELS